MSAFHGFPAAAAALGFGSLCLAEASTVVLLAHRALCALRAGHLECVPGVVSKKPVGLMDDGVWSLQQRGLEKGRVQKF